MSQTKYNYARLHLFLVTPILLLEFLPPRPMREKFVNSTVRFSGYLTMIILAVVAFLFSIFGWDGFLWENNVFITDQNEVFGTFYSVPYEECAWCALHTILIGLWIMSIWRSKPVPKKIRSFFGVRCLIVAVCLCVTYVGYAMLETGDKSLFYLGAQLKSVFPMFAIQYGLSGHLYMTALREYIIGIVVPSVYVVIIDIWALWRDIWDTDREYTTKITFFGLMFEQVLVYFLMSVLVVNGMMSAILTTEVYLAYKRKMPSASAMNVLQRVLFW